MMLKMNYEDQTQSSQQNLQETSSKMNLGHLFDDRGNYINELNLFLAHFNYVPNCISESSIDCKKADKWFAEKYQNDIRKHYFNKIKHSGQVQSEIDDIFYILFDDLIVNFDTNNSIARFLFHKTKLAQVEVVIEELKKFRIKKSKEKPELFLLINGFHGMECKPMEISKPKMNIQDNYNDDFKEINQIILKTAIKKQRQRSRATSRKTRYRKNFVYPLFNFFTQEECHFYSTYFSKCIDKPIVNFNVNRQPKFNIDY